MQTYLVGGAVRDHLLGLPVQDRDWVVVGATPEQMVAQGFVPVGRDFPVFLHPQTHEEYALARTERKSGSGYRGFVVQADPTVTLEEDLARRDLSINAMAVASDDLGADGGFDTARVIDPYGGQADLRQRVVDRAGNGGGAAQVTGFARAFLAEFGQRRGRAVIDDIDRRYFHRCRYQVIHEGATRQLTVCGV